MLKRLITCLIVLFAAGLAHAQPKAGVEYRELSSAQPTAAAGKIEIIEFFWYG